MVGQGSGCGGPVVRQGSRAGGKAGKLAWRASGKAGKWVWMPNGKTASLCTLCQMSAVGCACLLPLPQPLKRLHTGGCTSLD